MPTFPSLRSGTTVLAGGVNTGSSGGTLVSSSASTNTKGSWVEFFSSTTYEANGLYVFLRGSTNSVDILYDIGIGGSGSEQVIIPNLCFSMQAIRVSAGVYIPLRIPKGSRVSVRCQATTGSSGPLITLYLIGGGLKDAEGFSQAVNMGANTADSGGTSVDPGGTANTKGSYSQITAATTIEIGWLVICITNQNNGAVTTNVGLLDIAIGAGGSEQVVIPDLAYVLDSAIDTPEPQYYGFPVAIPKGSRIAARAQSSTNSSPSRLIDVTLIGLG